MIASSHAQSSRSFRKLFLIPLALIFLCHASAGSASPTVDRLLREGKIMLSKDLQRGMPGIGRSVFHGTEIESFKIEILGVLEKELAGADIILFRIVDGPVVQRQSGIIAGMSGSPVYVNGKLIGAIAYGWGFPKEPIGGITPIEKMIESSERAASGDKNAQVQRASLQDPLTVVGKTIRSVRVDGSRSSAVQPPRSDEMVLRPVSMPVMVNGFTRNGFNRLKTMLEEYNMEPVMGGGSAPTGASATIEPGAVASLELARGDLSLSGGGTVTFVDGERVWAFGHPFMEIGPTEFPLSTGYVVDIFPSVIRSFKFIAPIKPVGTIHADTPFAIAGQLGKSPAFIPMKVVVRDDEVGVAKTYHTELVNQQELTPTLITQIGADAIESVYGLQPEKTIRVSLKVAANDVQPIVRKNILFSRGPSVNAGLLDLAETVAILQNGEQRAQLQSIELSTELIHKRRSARIKRLFADKSQVKAGEPVEIGVELEPFKGEGSTWTESFRIQIPKDSPSGPMRIGVSNGRQELVLQGALGVAVAVPENLKDLVDFYQELHNNNDLVVKAGLPRFGVLVENKVLPMAPPGVLNVLTKARSTRIGISRDQITVARETDWSITGAIHVITLQIDSDRRPPRGLLGIGPIAGPRPAGPPSGAGDPPPPPPPSDDRDEWLDRGSRVLIKSDILKEFSQVEQWSRASASALAHQDLREMEAAAPRVPPSPPPSGPASGTPSPTAEERPDGASPASPIPAPSRRPTGSRERGIGRPNRIWSQNSDADFLQGKFKNTSVTSRGEVELAPPSSVVFTWEQPLVLSIAVNSKGAVFAGTGNDGKVFEIMPDGKRRLVLETKDLAVTSIAIDANDNVFVGSAPSGMIYRIDGEGNGKPFCDTKQSYVWQLAFDGTGALLAATGNRAQLLKISSDGKPETIASFPQEHVRALVIDTSNRIYVGTGEEGVLYQVDEGGKVTALYNVQDSEITSLAANAKGQVYFATSGSGTIWRWTPESRGQGGQADEVYRSPQQAVYALAAAKDGGVFAGTGDNGIVYHVYPDNSVARALDTVQGQSTVLTIDREGHLYAGMANGAAIYRVDLPSSSDGTYESAVLDATTTSQWLYLRWTARTSNGSYITIQTRSGNTSDPDETWSEWSQPYADPKGSAISSPSARFIQYRATLVAGNAGTVPLLSRVEVVYRTKNQRPAGAISGLRGGEEWSGEETIRIEARDPDNDILTYRILIQPADTQPEEGSQPSWKLATESRSNALTIDTSKFPDGVYRLRVLISDEASNPDDSLGSGRTIETVTFDNTPPALTITSATNLNDGRVRVEGSATDALTRIVSVDYRIEKGEWTAATPSQGVFSTFDEKFFFITPPLRGKPCTIQIRAKDAAGNTTTVDQAYAPPGAEPPKKEGADTKSA